MARIQRRAHAQLRRSGRAPLAADWRDACFIHFAVAPGALQPLLPFPLDVHAGQAWLSLVCFTQHRLRLRAFGSAGAWLLRPIGTHAFCNLRSYVRVRGEAAIVFLREWIPNQPACLLGPRSFGLPYQHGQLDLRHGPDREWSGHVASEGGELRYRCTRDDRFAPARDPLTRFLLERYSACTWRRGLRLFRIAHLPWPVAAARHLAFHDDLASRCCPLLRDRVPTLVHQSPGVRDVRISRPLGISRMGLKERAAGGSACP